MQGFWWFKENSVAGMARPGFNGVNWRDLPFEESIIFSWLGKRLCNTHSIDSLKAHILDYGTKISGFYQLEPSKFQQIREGFEDPSKVLEVLERLAEKTKCLEQFEVQGEAISFRLNSTRLSWEMDFLKKQGIKTIVTLTENHDQKEKLQNQFDLHHLAIDDLAAPRYEQAVLLAQVLREARSRQSGVAVHCMAGIGRTSTMLMAAHLLLGEKLEDLKAFVLKRNPFFKFVGVQADFVQAVAKRVQDEG